MDSVDSLVEFWGSSNDSLDPLVDAWVSSKDSQDFWDSLKDARDAWDSLKDSHDICNWAEILWKIFGWLKMWPPFRQILTNSSNGTTRESAEM